MAAAIVRATLMLQARKLGTQKSRRGQGSTTSRWQGGTHTQIAFFRPLSSAQVWPKFSPLHPQLPGGAQTHRIPGSYSLNLFPKRLALPQYSQSVLYIIGSSWNCGETTKNETSFTKG